MDPNRPYTTPNGLPQESKLASYLSRSATTPTRSLNDAMGKLNIDSSSQSMERPTRSLNDTFISTPHTMEQVQLTNEFIPMNYFSQASNMPDSPESPPTGLVAHMATTSQVHQENVGGTTYFYPANNDSLNASGLNTSGSMSASESCLSGGVGPGASPYAAQMYASAPPHMAQMNMKPGVPEPCLSGNMGMGGSPYATQMFAGTPPHMVPMNIKPGLAASFYQPETIRQEIYQRNEEMFMQADLRQFPDLPETVEMYAELIPLESAAPHSLATSFRATHRQTNEQFAIRRLHSYTNMPTERLEMWKNVNHPNVVRLHEFFTTEAFDDNSMVLVYGYHPGCETLMDKYLSGGAANSAADGNQQLFDPFSSDPDAPRPYTHQKNTMLRAVACGALLPEAVLWSLLVQLTAALRAIHGAGLACRSLDPTKVVMNGCRVRIAWVGAADATLANPNDITQAQQDDLTALGRLVLSLACRSIHYDNFASSLRLVARTYSADLKNVVLYLLSPANRRSVTDLMPMIGARFYTQVEALQRRADVFEDQLAREIDNSRLLRILIKMGVVNERPELNLDSSWSETGDRYLLKLFRDYLFHAVTPDGQPWIDQAHIAHCLNLIDAGTMDRVELMSRDEQSILVVSFEELKHCLDSSFEEVMAAAVHP